MDLHSIVHSLYALHRWEGSDLLEGIIILGWLGHLEGVVLHGVLELLEVHPAQGLNSGGTPVKCNAVMAGKTG